MTATQNVATYARIRPYNPAINEDKRLTARAVDGNKILNQNNNRDDTYNFTAVFDMTDNTNDLFEKGMKPLLDHKILQGINSIFIVYGQSGSGKSFTLIGEPGHLGVLPMSLQYLLSQDKVENVTISAIEAYGVKATKIGFYSLVDQLDAKKKTKKKKIFDPYASKDNPRVNSSNAKSIQITKDNVLKIITELQEVSHMAPTLKNPHSSRGHTVYFSCVKMTGLQDVYFIAVDLAGSEGQTALGTKDEFVNGLKLAMSKGKLKLSKKQTSNIEQMYKTRSLEAGCINNGLTQLQSIFGELIRKKISKSLGLGLRKVLSSFISLKSAYAILFTLSASANNNKVTRATLNFAKQTQLVKVQTVKAKVKIDKDAIIRELNELIEQLKEEMNDKSQNISDLNKTISDLKNQLLNNNNTSITITPTDKQDKKQDDKQDSDIDSDNDSSDDLLMKSVLDRMTTIRQLIDDDAAEQKKWTVNVVDIDNNGLKDNISNVNRLNMNENELKQIFDEFDTDHGGTIDADELQQALSKMGQNMTKSEINNLILEIDENDDGVIDFNEFKSMASQSWFINAYNNRLVTNMQRMMTTMDLSADPNFSIDNLLKAGTDDDDDDDMKIDDDIDDNKEEDLIKEINEQSNRIQKLEIEKEDELNKKNDALKEIEELKKELNRLRKSNITLSKDVDRLQEDNNSLLDNIQKGGSGGVMLIQQNDSQREIVSIQVGQCGNSMGAAFWETMRIEHKLSLGGRFNGKLQLKEDKACLDKIGVYYSEPSFMKFTPRICLIDLEPTIIDGIAASQIGDFFKPDNMCYGTSGTGNNWAKGHYTDGAEIVDDCMDIIRKEVEDCNTLQGFQLTHSLGGGTGSGLGTLILLKLRDEYPDRIIASFSVYPSRKVSDVVVEPYNAILSINQLLENSDETFVIDNEALFKISYNILKQKEVKYVELNWVISQVMSGITASLRFNGKLNGDLRKLGVNLVPFPRLHFFLLGHAPLFTKDNGSKINLTIQELTDQMWSNKQFLCKINSNNGKYLTGSCGFRGINISTQEVDDEISKIQQKKVTNDEFVKWIPNNIKTQIINIPPPNTPISGTFVANTTAIKSIFQRISAQFNKLYKRKAFLHWYKGEGMDEMEFQESDKNTRDLITEYQDKQDAVVDVDDDDDDDDDDDNDDDDDDDDDNDD